jgi:hypothetical protein
MLNTVLLFRPSLDAISLTPSGSFDRASKSKIAKHLSIAGTLLKAGLILLTILVPYMLLILAYRFPKKTYVFYIKHSGICQQKNATKSFKINIFELSLF